MQNLLLFISICFCLSACSKTNKINSENFNTDPILDSTYKPIHYYYSTSDAITEYIDHPEYGSSTFWTKSDSVTIEILDSTCIVHNICSGPCTNIYKSVNLNKYNISKNSDSLVLDMQVKNDDKHYDFHLILNFNQNTFNIISTYRGCITTAKMESKGNIKEKIFLP